MQLCTDVRPFFPSHLEEQGVLLVLLQDVHLVDGVGVVIAVVGVNSELMLLQTGRREIVGVGVGEVG